MRHLPVERRGQGLGDRHERWRDGIGAVRVPVAEVQVGLVEGSRHVDGEPPSVGRQTHARPVLLLGRLEDERIALGVVAEPVEVDRAVVGLLAVGNGPGRGVAGVVEAGAVGQPGEIGRARARDAVGQRDASDHVQHVQHALFAAVLGQSVGQEGPVVARVVPVERGRAGGIERVGIERHPVGPIDPRADVQDGLVLPAFAPQVEVPAMGRRRDADGADREQLVEPAANGCAPGHPGQIALGACVLRLGPGAGLGAFAVLEPAVGIGDRLPVERVGRVDGRGGRRIGLSHPGRSRDRGRCGPCRSRAECSWSGRPRTRAAPG